MGTKASDVVSGIGVFASVFTALDKEVRVLCGEKANEAWHRLGKPEGESVLKTIAKLIATGVTETFPVEIQQATLAELIRLGNYGWANGDINEQNFPLDNSQFGKFDLVLVHLNRAASTGEGLSHLDANGLVPAKIGHLLGFGAKYPDVQREFPIIALGSSWLNRGGVRSVPCLDYLGDDRGLSLDCYDDAWDDYCRFLALRK